MSQIEAVFADNCGACGEEYLSTELTAIKLAGMTLSRFRVCLGCMVHCDVMQDFKDVAEIIIELSDVGESK